MKYMINLAKYLSMDFEKQFHEMEWFARWDLPEEIGMEWIDAKGIITSKALGQIISTESAHLLTKILNNFELAFSDSKENGVWTVEAMYKHPFWAEQRTLAKQFLNSVLAE